MKHENIMLSEINQMQKPAYYVVPLIEMCRIGNPVETKRM
jgi:hypothetical protein